MFFLIKQPPLFWKLRVVYTVYKILYFFFFYIYVIYVQFTTRHKHKHFTSQILHETCWKKSRKTTKHHSVTVFFGDVEHPLQDPVITTPCSWRYNLINFLIIFAPNLTFSLQGVWRWAFRPHRREGLLHGDGCKSTHSPGFGCSQLPALYGNCTQGPEGTRALKWKSPEGRRGVERERRIYDFDWFVEHSS